MTPVGHSFGGHPGSRLLDAPNHVTLDANAVESSVAPGVVLETLHLTLNVHRYTSGATRQRESAAVQLVCGTGARERGTHHLTKGCRAVGIALPVANGSGRGLNCTASKAGERARGVSFSAGARLFVVDLSRETCFCCEIGDVEERVSGVKTSTCFASMVLRGYVGDGGGSSERPRSMPTVPLIGERIDRTMLQADEQL